MPNSPEMAALWELLLDRLNHSPQQRLTFAEYMELLLYAPNLGYYDRSPEGIGSRGDFFTSPHLGQDFGEMLAIQLAEMWQQLDRPRPFTVVEMGAGQGLVAQDILGYWQQHYPELLADYVIIETSTAMRRCQQLLLKDLPVRWTTWDDLPPASVTGCFFSNELIDALPVHQVIVQDGQLQEIYIKVNSAQQITEELDRPSTPKLLAYFELGQIPIQSYESGYRTEVNLAALDWLTTVATKLQRGYLLSIDYGYSTQRYYNPQRSQGTLQCYYQHRYHNNPYVNLGQQDLTAHVDFGSLMRQGQVLGLQELGFTKQGMFLMSLGLGDRLVNIATLERRQALHQLIDPLGLGGFGVLLQGKDVSTQKLQGFNAMT